MAKAVGWSPVKGSYMCKKCTNESPILFKASKFPAFVKELLPLGFLIWTIRPIGASFPQRLLAELSGASEQYEVEPVLAYAFSNSALLLLLLMFFSFSNENMMLPSSL